MVLHIATRMQRNNYSYTRYTYLSRAIVTHLLWTMVQLSIINQTMPGREQYLHFAEVFPYSRKYSQVQNHSCKSMKSLSDKCSFVCFVWLFLHQLLLSSLIKPLNPTRKCMPCLWEHLGGCCWWRTVMVNESILMLRLWHLGRPPSKLARFPCFSTEISQSSYHVRGSRCFSNDLVQRELKFCACW